MTPDIKRILVPLDFSVSAKRALDYAHGLALKFNAVLHLVHVCEVPSMMTGSMDAYAIAYTDWSQKLGEAAEELLLREQKALADVPVTTSVLFGSPAAAIIDEAAAHQADLIVMGTHGHGAVMHMVVGNVAERVVRGASCPVLTVREPRAREAVTGAAKNVTVVGAVIAALLFGGSAALAQDAAHSKPASGSALYMTYCASCHGAAARGDGPLASNMIKKPSNLTEMAKHNGGKFPSELVFKAIEGRQPIRGHGGPEMPVWGDAFSRSSEGGDAARVKTVIQSLVDYLESLQLRPGHE